MSAAPAQLREMERLYLEAPINQLYKPRIRIEDGRCEIAIPVSPQHFHALGALHGSVYFKVLDDAAFFAANSRVPERFVLTSAFTTYFLRPVKEGELRAVGRIVHEGKRQLVAEAVATDADGQEVARGSGTFVVSSLPFTVAGAAPPAE